MVDERDRHSKDIDADLAIAQPRMDALLSIADKADAEMVLLRIALEPKVLGAQRALRDGDHLIAATVFDEIAARYREHGFGGEADTWERRAQDARIAHRLWKRVQRKGGFRR